MLVANVADSHFDETSRFEECIKVHDWIANDIAERGVGLVLHGGDVYERRSTPDERRAAGGFFRKCAETAPVVIVRGNHDPRRDVLIMGMFGSHHPIHVVEDARVIREAGCNIGCLAWPRRSSILAVAAEHGYGHEGAEQIAGDALRAVLRGLGHMMDDRSGPKILLAHAMVRNARTSTGQPLVGCDMEVGVDDLRLAGADFYSIGHVHMGQLFRDNDGGDIVYPGSPRRTAFGETEEKGYVIYDTEARTWFRVPTPCAPMLLLETEWVDGEFSVIFKVMGDGSVAGYFPESMRDAEIRLRYTVDADQREAAFAAAVFMRKEMLAFGAAAVKLDAVVRSSVKARAPQVAMAKGTRDKLKAFWNSQADPPPDERRERLLVKLAELEAT